MEFRLALEARAIQFRDILLQMPGREFLGHGSAPKRQEGWNSDELHVHVRGRAEVTIRILIIGASLRSQDLLPSRGVVTVTGAKWQDWRGTRDQPMAHRFPCNPQIGGRDLPDFAKKPAVRLTIQRALAETDSLPFHVNYADRLFEEFGGIESARKGLEKVLSLQRANASVDHAMIASVWKSVLSGYVGAWAAVERELSDKVKNEKTFAFLERVAGFRRHAPTDDIETVMDVAYDAKRSTELVSQPPILSSPGISAYLKDLTD